MFFTYYVVASWYPCVTSISVISRNTEGSAKLIIRIWLDLTQFMEIL